MKRLLIILMLLLLASTTYAAYWLNDSYSMGGGLAANKMRTIITRSNGAAVDTVKDSTITATINNSVNFKTWAVDSLVPHCISHVYMTADGDTFPEQVCDIYPTEFAQYARRGVANSQAVRDSMDEAAQVGAGSGGGCPDSVGNAWTIVAWDSVNNVEVTNAIITLKSSVSSSVPLAQATSPFTFTKSSGSAVVVIEANGVTFPVRSFTISGARVDTINGGGLSVIATGNPALCTIYGQVDRNGSPVVGLAVSIVLTRPDTLAIDSAFVDFNKTEYTDANGVWTSNVYFLAGSTRNFYYTVTFTVAGQKRVLYCRPTAQGGPYLINDILVEKP